MKNKRKQHRMGGANLELLLHPPSDLMTRVTRHSRICRNQRESEYQEMETKTPTFLGAHSNINKKKAGAAHIFHKKKIV
jgi:hypothetical protein